MANPDIKKMLLDIEQNNMKDAKETFEKVIKDKIEDRYNDAMEELNEARFIGDAYSTAGEMLDFLSNNSTRPAISLKRELSKMSKNDVVGGRLLRNFKKLQRRDHNGNRI